MKLLFTGDINFRGFGVLTYEKCKEILSEVQPYLDSVDYIIPNLECPLADKTRHSPIKKAGPNLIGEPENIVFLKAMNASAVTLANNHTGDYGDGAICDTFATLLDNNISYCGAGKNVFDAYKACQIEDGDAKISIISVCENEFGLATEASYGSAGYNPRLLMKSIKEEKSVSDYVIVVFHGGNEFNPLPSPDTVDRYRFICDMGADAVIGGHTHCPQGYELYEGKPIIYSMGNFLFKSSSEKSADDSWYYGYMTILDINDSISFKLVPYKFDVRKEKLIVFDGDDKTKMTAYIDRLADIIQFPSELQNYFSGWTWTHMWCPVLPDDFNKLDEYTNASGNFDLIRCEAHLSQLKEALRYLHFEETNIAREWSEKIAELIKMPI